MFKIIQRSTGYRKEIIMDYTTIEELMKKAHEAEGKTFGEIDSTNRLANAKSKGGLGQVIEESFLDMKSIQTQKLTLNTLVLNLK